jgi:hypothetical protein
MIPRRETQQFVRLDFRSTSNYSVNNIDIWKADFYCKYIGKHLFQYISLILPEQVFPESLPQLSYENLGLPRLTRAKPDRQG